MTDREMINQFIERLKSRIKRMEFAAHLERETDACGGIAKHKLDTLEAVYREAVALMEVPGEVSRMD